MPDIFVSKNNSPIEPRRRRLHGESKINKTYSLQNSIINEAGVKTEKDIGFFSSFSLKPRGITFKDQGEDEIVYLFLRRHFITNLSWILISIILILLPLPFIFAFNIFQMLSVIPFAFKLVFIGFYYLTIVSYVLINFMSWFYNISIITQERVIDIDYSDVVYHKLAVTNIDLIEDVDFVQSGFFRSFFRYGDIFIQTAGEKLNFHFLAVPEPDRAVNIIHNLMGGDTNVE